MRRSITPVVEYTNEIPSYLLSLRPRDLQNQIIDTLRANDLPLISIEDSFDFKLIKRLIADNSKVKEELIELSLASYHSKQNSSTRGAETLLNYFLSKLNLEELTVLKDIISQTIVDDSVVIQIINLMRLTGSSDPIIFIDLLEKSLDGTLNLRTFMSGLDRTMTDSSLRLGELSTREVPTDIINAINETEGESLIKITQQLNKIEGDSIENVDRIGRVNSVDTNRILLDTGVAFGVSGLIWLGYRAGFWEYIVSSINTQVLPPTMRQNDPTVLTNLQIGLAGLTGFLLKKVKFR